MSRGHVYVMPYINPIVIKSQFVLSDSIHHLGNHTLTKQKVAEVLTAPALFANAEPLGGMVPCDVQFRPKSFAESETEI